MLKTLKNGSVRRGANLALAVALPAVIWVSAASIPELQQGALFLLPMFLLLALWRAGVDPTDLLERFAGRKPQQARRADALAITRFIAVIRSVSGGRLIACSMAGRAPPLALATA